MFCPKMHFDVACYNHGTQPPHSHYELNRVAVKLIWLTSVEQAYIVDSSFDLSFVQSTLIGGPPLYDQCWALCIHPFQFDSQHCPWDTNFFHSDVGLGVAQLLSKSMPVSVAGAACGRHLLFCSDVGWTCFVSQRCRYSWPGLRA